MLPWRVMRLFSASSRHIKWSTFSDQREQLRVICHSIDHNFTDPCLAALDQQKRTAQLRRMSLFWRDNSRDAFHSTQVTRKTFLHTTDQDGFRSKMPVPSTQTLNSRRSAPDLGAIRDPTIFS